jgi:hypothetical protein
LTPQAADLPGRVVSVEHGGEPSPLLGREVLGAGQQQLPVHPQLVTLAAAAAQLLAGDPLPHLGDHAVSECDQMPLVDCDPRVRQRGTDPGGILGGRSMITISMAFRKASVCSPSQVFTQPPMRPGANPSSDPGPSAEQSTKLVSHGSDRFQMIPSSHQRTDRNRVSSIPSPLVGSGSGSHAAAALTKALCAVGHDT